MGYRKLNILIYSVCWILLLMFGTVHTAGAQVESYQKLLQGKIKKGDTLVIKDEKFRNDAFDWKSINNKLVNNVITFGLYRDSTYSIDKPFKCELDLKIEYWSQPDQDDPITIEHARININYDTAWLASYQGENIYSFTNAYKVKLTVNDITSKELGTDLPAIFSLKGEVIVDRQYTSNKEEELSMTAFFKSGEPGAVPGKQGKAGMMPMGATANTPPLTGMVNVNWNEIIPGNEYDLEWTYIDEESVNGRFLAANRSSITDAQLEEMFRNNSTRITTDQHNYDITLLHSSKYLLLRIRYVVYVNGFREEHPWVYQVKLASGEIARVLDLAWHQPGFNWQFSASYAEGGKKKEVVSYFDGILKNRQTVTINNTDKNAILQENVYDEFGRVAANILPAPIQATNLNYYGKQNLNSAGKVYSYRDIYNNSTGSCVVMPAPLKETFGAALYYSGNNPFKTLDSAIKYVPDAGGYPFAITAYTNDNTGRVRVKGGVGQVLQPNQDEALNHSTRYFYGKPLQWELDRLFGSNAGKASHFLKNMVIDPNGQISVSYLNSSGKPVATALSGGAPDNVLPLVSKGVTELVDVPVLEPESFVFDQQELKLRGNATYLCAVPDHNASIRYRIDKLIKKYKENAVEICSNCYYELKIDVYDDCNNKVDGNVTPIRIGSPDPNCADEGFVENSFIVDLGKAGEYSIRFELSLNPDVIERYTDDFIKRNTNLQPEFYFIINQLKTTDFTGCVSDCHTCEVALGTKAEFQQKVWQRIADNKVNATLYTNEINNWSGPLYDILKMRCTIALLNCAPDPCRELRETLKQDVSPGGQYAQFDTYGRPLEQGVNILSLYFRTVFKIDAVGGARYDSTRIVTVDGVSISPCDASFTLQDLVTNWRPEWADLFLPYHWEYCALQSCESLSAVKRWDEKITSLCLKASDLPKYVGSTYDRNNPTWLLNADPFLTNNAAQPYINSFVSDLNNYSRNRTPYKSSTFNNKNIWQYVDYLLYCADSTGNTNATTDVTFVSRWNNCVPQAQCRVPDREWLAYAEYYFQLKEIYYQRIRDARCGDICKIGRPIPVLGESCATVTDFSFAEDTVNACGAGSKRIRVNFEGNRFTTETRVGVTYSTGSGNTSEVLTFNAGDRYKMICVPQYLPLSVLKVDSVYCRNSGAVSFPPKVIASPNCRTDYVVTTGSTLWHNTYFYYITFSSPLAEGTEYVFKLKIYKDSIITVNVRGPLTVYEGTAALPDNTSPSAAEMEVKVISVSCYQIDGGCSPLFRNKISRMERIDYDQTFSMNPDSLRNDGFAQIANLVADNCANNADVWMSQLNLSGYGDAQKTTLRQKLIEVCKLGGDTAHLSGASAAVPTATAEGYRSFKDVMLGVLGAGSIKMENNPWILSGPYPYNVKAQTSEAVIGNTNAAICARLSVLQADYNIKGAGRTFFRYLTDTYGKAMNLKQEELDQLIKSCGNCRYLLATQLTLPVFLEVNAKGCITPGEFTAAMTALNQEPWNGGLSVEDGNYETIVATYLNHRWGFSLGYSDYEDYRTKVTAGTSELLCNEPVYKSVTPDPAACLMEMIDGAIAGGRRRYVVYIDSVRQEFRRQYITVCAGTRANANLKTQQQLYHFTLYYYDQAGNLVRTVPPEGVDVLSAERLNKTTTEVPADFACNYNGDPFNTALPSALNELTSSLNIQTGVAVEMWIKGRPTGATQVLTPTSNNNYFFTTCVSNTYCYVSIYKMNPETNAVSFVRSNDIAVPIATFTAGNWLHLVVQSGNLMDGVLNTYVNGRLLNNDTKAPPAPCAWDVTVGTGGVSITNDLSDLKHLRTYNRQLTGEEIWANSQEPCMALVAGQDAKRFWGRFNTPANGAPGTVGGPNSNVEVRPVPVQPQHRLATDYAYTSLNQVSTQKTPDAGVSGFWYDYKGRLIASRNAKQAKRNNNYSYSVYDALGRIIETGEVLSNVSIFEPGFINGYGNLLVGALSNPERIYTTYDSPVLPSGLGTQDNLRNRVSSQGRYVSIPTGGYTVDNFVYSYDLLGNVKTFWHGNGSSDYKQTDYNYDLISGKVNAVRYQPGKDDQFYYGYAYDAENRLVTAKSGISSGSADKWAISDPVTDAYYYYYKHGPLSRMEYLRDRLQGIDYAYTLQGWLKGMNGNYLQPTSDMGMDADQTAPRKNFAKDVVSYTLDYFKGDYTPISKPPSGINPFTLAWNGNAADIAGQDLYNGNIARSELALKGINGGNPVGYAYRYDQLNRLRTMRQRTMTSGAATWELGNVSAEPYAEDLTYDASGNILTYNRNTGDGQPMDRLTYNYPRNGGGQLTRNRLRYVKDGIKDPVYPGMDIGNQAPAVETVSDIGNAAGDAYMYDEIGNLIKDGNDVSEIEWNVIGKIKSFKKGTLKTEYFYDPAGNRSRKVVETSANNYTTTFYERDATGNVLATYEQKTGSADIIWKEQYLYGSSRLGVWKPNMKLGAAGTKDALWTAFNNREYEITNHLGNVLTTITDKRTVTGGVYDVAISSAVDYSPFGMQLVGRKMSGGGYRYGFNGKENDNDVKGEGNQQDYGMRIYDPRIGKFLSVDPITYQYPELTPYQFASNSPIQGVDFDGLELVNSNQEPRFLKVVGGQATLATTTTIVVTRTAEEAGKRMAVNAAGRLVTSTGIRIGGSTIGAAVLTAILTVIPLQTSNYENSKSWIDQKQAAMEKAKAFYAQSHIEEFRDPSGLSDEYLRGVQDRILKGDASGQDYLYKKEIARRNLTGSESSSRPTLHILGEEGGIIGGKVKYSNGLTVGFMADKTVNGTTLEFTNTLFYPDGVDGNQLKNAFGAREMLETLNAMKDYAKDQGYEKVRIQWKRAENSSSRNPGHEFDRTFDLNK
ncbi:RHS repeat-associated core domain-containing protein [Chitinophaga arvensicola]|uniref:RHS repeat-associated core domain-containing protein n=1 Tax=Chitinophaga arvensicola TaxID=29529 RepID=A0A1I0S9E9_9BACT|nr:RHS repeat-associated core domain-containing protein [Chitinophaga arvensicola]SEW52800.1 RHS repeat-associated core domain-containing protein [Chitinophaga arvensicola]